MLYNKVSSLIIFEQINDDDELAKVTKYVINSQHLIAKRTSS